jgi:hypothetical protein
MAHGTSGHRSSRSGIWEFVGFIAFGLALVLAGKHVGFLFVIFGIIGLGASFHSQESKESKFQRLEPLTNNEVETTSTRLRKAQVPNVQITAPSDSRCYFCKNGIANRVAWVQVDGNGEMDLMCEVCRDSLIIAKRKQPRKTS